MRSRWEDAVPERLLTIPPEIWGQSVTGGGGGAPRGRLGVRSVDGMGSGVMWKEVAVDDGTFNQA